MLSLYILYMHKDWFLAAPSVFISRRQEELEARLVEEETTKRVEELVAKRVQEELERRKDEIEREVLRRVEEAKKVGGAKPEGGLSSLVGQNAQPWPGLVSSSP